MKIEMRVTFILFYTVLVLLHCSKAISEERDVVKSTTGKLESCKLKTEEKLKIKNIDENDTERTKEGQKENGSVEIQSNSATTEAVSTIKDPLIAVSESTWSEVSELTTEPTSGDIFDLELEEIPGFDDIMNSTNFVRIAGGTTERLDKYPFLMATKATLFDGSTISCNAFLITYGWAVTSAFCMNNANSIEFFIEPTGPGDGVPVTTSTFAHYIFPKYEMNNVKHDIALIQITPPLASKDTVRPTFVIEDQKLAKYSQFDGAALRVAGTSPEHFRWHDSVRYVDLVQMPRHRCTNLFRNRLSVPSTTLCLDSRSGTMGPCVGDWGSPVLYRPPGFDRWVIVGLISYISGCPSHDPSLYTPIGPYIKWIESYVATGLQKTSVRV